MNQIGKYMIGVFVGVMLLGMTVFAAEITPVNMVLVTNEETVVYAEADLASVIILPEIQAGLPIQVIGITDNGFFQINIGDIYYVPGYGLNMPTIDSATVPEVTLQNAAGISEEIYVIKQNYNEYIVQVVELVNMERQNAGLAPLAYDEQMTYAATHRSYEGAAGNIFSHTRPNGERCFTVFDEYHVSYRSAGENIAMGYNTPEKVMNGWMNSLGHRANILTAGFTKIGVGIAPDVNGRLYWTQLFAS